MAALRCRLPPFTLHLPAAALHPGFLGTCAAGPAAASTRLRQRAQGILTAASRADLGGSMAPIQKQGVRGIRIGYCTDIEGNLDYFHRLVERPGSVLRWTDPAARSELELQDEGCYFVHGGDTVDKGPGDVRLCRMLVDLKRRHPERVFLLVGNRDLNKLRYSAELAECDLARPIDDIPGPHWDPQAKTLREHLEALAEETGRPLDELNTRAERLRYMQQHTLGCAHTFEFRRQELALLHGRDLHDISCEEVAEHCLQDVVSPSGALRQYLEHGCVACRIGNTLFVHGAIDRHSMRFVPSSSTRFELPSVKLPPAEVVDTVDEWVEGMNRFLRTGLEDFAARPHWDEGRGTRGGESLMALQNREAMFGRTVISACFSDGGCITTSDAQERRAQAWSRAEKESDPTAFRNVCSDALDTEVARWLMASGVRRLVVGHKPSADCPAVLAGSITGLEVVSADTSFSDTRASDNRGSAVSSVLITGDTVDSNRLEIEGVLGDGAEHHAALPSLSMDETLTDGDPHVGRPLPSSSWWVQTRLKGSPGAYRLIRGQGRKWETKVVTDLAEA